MHPTFLDRHHVKPVLNAIRQHDGIRFADLKRATGLLDPQVDRAIKVLKESGLVWARSIPTKGARVYAEYVLSPRGKKLAKALDAMARTIATSGLDADMEKSLRDWLLSPREVPA